MHILDANASTHVVDADIFMHIVGKSLCDKICTVLIIVVRRRGLFAVAMHIRDAVTFMHR